MPVLAKTLLILVSLFLLFTTNIRYLFYIIFIERSTLACYITIDIGSGETSRRGFFLVIAVHFVHIVGLRFFSNIFLLHKSSLENASKSRANSPGAMCPPRPLPAGLIIVNQLVIFGKN